MEKRKFAKTFHGALVPFAERRIINMEKIYKKSGYAVSVNENKYQISWQVGTFGKNVYYDISKENMEKALKSDEDAYEVMVYAETGKWPLKPDEQIERNKNFIRKFPELLIKIPENQKLFDEEELKVLLAKINN